jgi:hypothetical protein
MSNVEWLRAAVSPTDTSRKDSALPPVTSENPRPREGKDGEKGAMAIIKFCKKEVLTIPCFS